MKLFVRTTAALSLLALAACSDEPDEPSAADASSTSSSDGAGTGVATDADTTAGPTTDPTTGVDTGGSDSEGGSDTTGEPDDLPTLWERIVIREIRSSAYVAVDDLDDDGNLDIVLSTLMEIGDPSPFPPPPTGAVHLFTRNGRGLDDWDEQIVLSTDAGLGFVNGPQIFDADGDGSLDIMLNTGFLAVADGSHQYLPGPDFGAPVPFAEQTAPGSTWFWHETVQSDVDGDGDLDLVTTRTDYEGGFTSPATWELALDWYRNDGGGTFVPFEFDTGHCGTHLKMYDVDSDGDEDVVCVQFFGPPAEPSIVWIEQAETPSEANGWVGQWTTHTVDATTGLGFDLHFLDIDADGDDELVYSNHNNQNNPDLGGLPSGLYAFEIPADPASTDQWDRSTIDEGYEVTAPDMGNPASQGAPGLVGSGDIDGNGLLDLVTAGDGADGLFVIWQTEAGVFERRTIAVGSMFGQAVVVDVDGDGLMEVVAAHHMAPEGLTIPTGNISIYRPLW